MLYLLISQQLFRDLLGAIQVIIKSICGLIYSRKNVSLKYVSMNWYVACLKGRKGFETDFIFTQNDTDDMLTELWEALCANSNSIPIKITHR